MNMKKIMASVAAAALAVSAMATSAFAAENPTYYFTKKTYGATPNAATFSVAGMNLITTAENIKFTLEETFTVPDGWKEAKGTVISQIGNAGKAVVGDKNYDYTTTINAKYTYYVSTDDAKTLKTETIPVNYSKDNWTTPTKTYFELKVVDENAAEVDADAFNLAADGATAKKVVTRIDLEVSAMADWNGGVAAGNKEIKGTPDVKIGFKGEYSIAGGTVSPAPSATNPGLTALLGKTADTKAKIISKETEGLALVNGEKKELSLEPGFTKWLSNNIGFNKGAQLKFTFMTKAEIDSILGSTSVDATGGKFEELPFEDQKGAVIKDFAIGVNIEDTLLLQANGKVGDDNTIIVEWDDVIKSYASTVGDIHSVFIRLGKANTVLKNIEIIIPEQETVDNERTDSAEAPDVTGEEGEDTTAELEDPEESDITDGEEGEEGEDTDSSIEDGEEGEEGEDTSAEEGDNTGDNGEAGNKGENPTTGVALAIVPAIVAGAAVVISRKRK